MRLIWKIAIPVLCLAVTGGAAFSWSIYSAKLNERKLVEAAQACRARAEQGDVKAEFNLAHMYYSGRGVPQNYAQAFLWCNKAADQGDAKAEYDLASFYLHGEGVSRDYAGALSWYRKSAGQGNAWGEYGVGFMYYNGFGVSQDYAEAARWFRTAADHGNAFAQNELGHMYNLGLGVPRDNTESARWYRKAADQGYALGESGIGFMLWYGYGVPQDRAEANRWFRKAADQGDEYAMRSLSGKFTTSKKLMTIVELIAGIILILGFLMPGKGESNGQLKVLAPIAGVCCLLSGSLSWYGNTHYMFRSVSSGPNAFTLIKMLLNAIVIVLLTMIARAISKSNSRVRETVASESGAEGTGDGKQRR